MNMQESLAIQQLQQEIKELKQNEKDYQELNYLLTNCEHRFNLLSEEKIKNEQDYEKRIESLQDTIADLRTKVDSQNQELNEATQELQELKTEYYRLVEIQQELLELKKDIPQLLEENEKLKEQLNQNMNYNIQLKEEKFKISEGFDQINQQFENQLMDQSKLKEQVENYQVQNMNLQKELQQEKQKFATELQKLILNFTEINGIIDSEKLLDNQTKQLENNITSQLNQISSILKNEKINQSKSQPKQYIDFIFQFFQDQFQPILYSVQKNKAITESSIIKTAPHYQFTNIKK